MVVAILFFEASLRCQGANPTPEDLSRLVARCAPNTMGCHNTSKTMVTMFIKY
jgi:hypothetical protein